MRLGERLVAVADAIDDMRLFRLVGEERSLVDQALHLALGEMTGLGDAMGDLTGHRAEQIVELFALRRGHLGFGQYVRRGFVLLTMLETRLDADPVEQAPQKR